MSNTPPGAKTSTPAGNKGGNAAVSKSGNAAVSKSGNAAVSKSGNAAVSKSGNTATGGAAAGKGSQKKAGDTSGQAGAQEKVALVTGTVLALCEEVPASGLFLIFRSVPEGEEAKFNGIWDVLWGEKAQQKPERSEFVSDDAFKRYQRQYTLAFVDGDGFLQPVLDTSNPWKEIQPQLYERWKREAQWAKQKRKGPPPLATRSRNPYAIVLHEKMKVEVCLVRHPSPHLARALTQYLNTGQDKHGYGFKQWGATSTLLRKLPVEVGGQDGKQLLLKLPTAASHYFPAGSPRYGGWLLYRDMPLGERPEIKEQIQKLQLDLGSLRYPVGGNTPYYPTKGMGLFDLQLMSAVHGFQIDAAGTQAFQVAASQRAHAHPKARIHPGEASKPQRRQPKVSWAYLLGAPVTRKPDLDLQTVEPGVVDKQTAAAIQKWIADGLRKPGDVLLEVATGELHGKGFNWNEWGRTELVTSIELWRDLVHAFGCDYGIEFGHTFRELASPGGEGKAEFSIHKTGMAVDLAMKGGVSEKDDLHDYSRPVSHFPIRYEADWHPDKSTFLRGRERAHQAAKAAREAAEKKLADARAKAKAAVEAAQKKLTQAESARQTAQTQLDAALISQKGVRAKQASKDAAGRAVATSQQELTTRQGELQALDAPEHPLQKALDETRQQEAQAQAELDDAPRVSKLAKAEWHIRWRLYGHSTWDITPHPTDPDALKKKVAEALGPRVPGGEYRLVEEYRQSLQQCFPDPQAAQEWLKPHLKRCREVADRLMAMSGEQLLKEFFRDSVYQWNYNPYEMDGGNSGTEPIYPADDAPARPAEPAKKSDALLKSKALDYLDASLNARMEGVSVEARSFVNLTLLGFECDLWRIRAQQAGWRDPRTDPEASKRKPPVKQFVMDKERFGPVAGLLDRMVRPDSAHTQDVLVLKGPEHTVERSVAQLDVDFMKRWAKALFTFSGAMQAGPISELIITLDTTDASKQAVAARLREYGDKRFRLQGFGNRVKLEEFAEVATGERWAQLLEGAFDAFRAWVNAEKEQKAQQLQASPEASSPTDRRKKYKDTKKGQGKAPPPPKEPQLTGNWTLTLQPLFDLPLQPGADAWPDEPFTFLPGDVIELPTPGNGRTLEWWHYETKTANSRPWGQLLVDIGHSYDVLSQPREPDDANAPRALHQGGMGLDKASVLDVDKGGAWPHRPENHSAHRLEGG